MNPKVDFFFNKAGQWQTEFEKLRTIALKTELKEDARVIHTKEKIFS